MRWTVGKKLLWGIGIPALIVALLGLGFYWRRTTAVVAQSTRDEADAVAELIATSFTLTDPAARPGQATAQVMHRAVTQALRSDWKMFDFVQDVRVIGRDGEIVWSRRIEEEGRPFAGAEELLKVSARQEGLRDGRAEVVRPLGGMACAGCHQAHAMRVGVLQLSINQPKLQAEVTSVFQSALVSVLLFAGVLVLATFLSLRWVLRNPLKRLARAMERAEAGDFLVRAHAQGHDEISTLAGAFNRMLSRLTAMKAEEIDTQRDLHAAHEKLSLQAELEKTNAQLETRVRALTLLYDVARSFTATLELPELLGRITELIATRLDIPQFSVMLAEGDGTLAVKCAYPPGAGTEGISFPVGEGACGVAAKSRTSVYLHDLSQHSAIYVRHHPGEVGSLLAVPMIHKDEVIGVLNFQRPIISAFSEEDVDLLTAVADQAALAVKNARLHEETVALSLTDPLTGAPNRRALFSRLEMEIARANRFGNQVSVLMIDIDHFKLLNDTAGHRAGDVVLRQIYDVMARIIRKVDTLARYGGEEFVLVLTQVPKGEALEVAEKLRKAISDAPLPFGKTQPGGRITISVGVSNLPVDSTELEKLVDCADSALYASKRGGRDRVTGYAPGMELHPGRERGPHAKKAATASAVPAATKARE